MGHLSDGALRRLVDEPLAISEDERGHVAACAECRARADRVAQDARAVAMLLAVPEFRPDTAAALRRVTLLARPALLARLPALPSGARALAALAAVVVIAFTLTATGLADSFIRVFEPKQFVSVPVTESDLRSLPDLSAFGTTTWSGPGASEWTNASRALQTGDLAVARGASGLAVVVPQRLPASVDASTRQFRVVGAARMTFAFDPARATPPIAGSHLYVDVGPLVLQLYRVHSGGRDLPGLVIAEAKAPVVSSDGVTVTQLRDYLLAQPGVSSDLAARIRAIAEPESTLPVPVPVDRALARSVTVNGRAGLLIGDATGAGSVVFWRDGDVVRAVFGPLTDTEVLAIATSLR